MKSRERSVESVVEFGTQSFFFKYLFNEGFICMTKMFRMKCYNDPRLQEALVVQRISTGKVEMTNSVAFAFTLMPLGKI